MIDLNTAFPKFELPFLYKPIFLGGHITLADWRFVLQLLSVRLEFAPLIYSSIWAIQQHLQSRPDYVGALQNSPVLKLLIRPILADWIYFTVEQTRAWYKANYPRLNIAQSVGLYLTEVMPPKAIGLNITS